MALRNLPTAITYKVVRLTNPAQPVNNDQANHTLTLFRDNQDGTAIISSTPHHTPTPLPLGRYGLALDANENTGIMMTLDGSSSTGDTLFVATSWENYLNAVVGSPDGTSIGIVPYNTADSGDAYFQQKLYTDDWFNANPTDKQKSLCDAHEIIEQYAYIGERTTLTQTNEWPRKLIFVQGTENQLDVSSTIVPDNIRVGELLIAKVLLGGFDPEAEARNRGVSSRRYASVGTTYDTNNVADHVQAGCPSAEAWRMIRPYIHLTNAGTISLRRV